ncbi:hypothetical protein [Odoribacter lunatus]|uniref:hypothetical protein n=1 Tax=Odoribacter lunatus TaxID=2941335 RepID=UPI00203B4215|nr:hypothetical protein [Odoribacter lunatus]
MSEFLATGCYRTGFFSRRVSGSRPRVVFSADGRREEIPARFFVADGRGEEIPVRFLVADSCGLSFPHGFGSPTAVGRIGTENIV